MEPKYFYSICFSAIVGFLLLLCLNTDLSNSNLTVVPFLPQNDEDVFKIEPESEKLHYLKSTEQNKSPPVAVTIASKPKLPEINREPVQEIIEKPELPQVNRPVVDEVPEDPVKKEDYLPQHNREEIKEELIVIEPKTCEKGYSGENCDKSPCDSENCSSGRKCVTEDTEPYFNCECQSGQTGFLCNEEEDETEKKYLLMIKSNYTATPMAHPPPGSSSGFTGAWPIPSEMPYSDHRDTSCPMTRKSRFRKKLVNRYPDAIGIGFPKCGTGTLGFIDCNSKLVFRESEPYYWNGNKIPHGLKEYTIPFAAADEILIEKTPDYSLGSYLTLKRRAENMKEKMPNAKLIVLLCDPATRAFSHIKHQSTGGQFSHMWNGVKNSEPIKALVKLADYVDPNNDQEHLKVMDDILTYGNYATQLKPFFEVFGKENFHFVDGGGIVTNPTPEFGLLETFFGLENELDFRFNREKGFPCLHRPVPMCLSAAKGRTRGTGAHSTKPDEICPDEMKSLRTHYTEEMLNIFEIVMPELSLDEFCYEPELHRFSWLRLFICPDVLR